MRKPGSMKGSSQGFTVIAVVIAAFLLVAGRIAATTVGAGFVFVTRAWTDQLGREQSQQSLRAAVETLTRELRLAGVCMPPGTLPPITSTYQPLTGTHGTTDTITVTSNPACAGPATVT